jgi:BirA family transcriptional regulator, biotin operon repressor / biotin---[acetyl-CoA-carboxylase] ligase
MIETIHIHETSSTNSYLGQLIKEKPLDEGSMVYADFQTQGRGVSTNVWESEKAKNLLCSILLRPTFVPIKQQFIISQVVSLAITDVLRTYSTAISIKWPNDIYWNDKKIAGILIENNLQNGLLATCIIGIGLNVNQETFHSSAPNPISLIHITNTTYHIATFATSIRNAIFERYIQLLKGKINDIQKEYTERLYRSTGVYVYEDEKGAFNASIHQVTPDGYLELKRENGNHQRYAFKEVRFIP